MKAEVGKTKDAGFQVGARRTVNAGYTDTWDFMFSKAGLEIWLEGANADSFEVGKEIALDGGRKAKITVFDPYSHIRMKLSSDSWKSHSRLQLRVMEANGKSVVAFHQELLDDADHRAEMKMHWNSVLESIFESLL